MKNETIDCLPKFVPNDWRTIAKQSESIPEFLTATFTKAMKECFDYYKPRTIPLPPQGFKDDYEKYECLSYDKKSDAWKTIEEKYRGYLYSKDRAIYESKSDYLFLKTMREHFKNLGILNYVKMIDDRLKEFLDFFMIDCFEYRKIVPNSNRK